jgi:hypothetical protein
LAVSTGIGVIASLVFGRLYDNVGLPIVLVAVLLSSLFAPLAGGVTAGLLYDRSIIAVIVFSVAIQLTALPLFARAQRMSPSAAQH